MHLVIYFMGTGDESSFGNIPIGFKDINTNQFTYDGKQLKYLNEKGKENIRLITVQGCHKKEVCDAELFPNLASFARRFVNKLFKKDIPQLTTSDLKSLEVGIEADYSSVAAGDEDKEISGITLCGYSRGAVECFEVAKVLDKIAPTIPIYIVVNQPVPGNMYLSPGSNAVSIADCSKVKNIQSASIILGAYTGQVGEGIVGKFQRLIHRAFFSQIIPALPVSAKRELIVIPRVHHWEMEPTGENHTHYELAKNLHDLGYVDESQVEYRKVIASETNYLSFPPLFPQAETLQTVFGINRDTFFAHKDPLHPSPYLHKGMELHSWDNIFEWWKKHDKSASFFSSKMTKDLVKVIKETDKDNKEKMIDLYKATEKWLMVKDNTPSTRYYQVTALRNNIFHLLTTEFEIKPQELNLLNYNLLRETNYFRSHWEKLSREASSFKTQKTRDLDKAFLNYSLNLKRNEVDQDENDHQLRYALDTWLEAKRGSNSKRYDIVVGIREHLQRVIDKKAAAMQEEDKDLDEGLQLLQM